VWVSLLPASSNLALAVTAVPVKTDPVGLSPAPLTTGAALAITSGTGAEVKLCPASVAVTLRANDPLSLQVTEGVALVGSPTLQAVPRATGPVGSTCQLKVVPEGALAEGETEVPSTPL
jgi:hypothetical protein